MAECFRTTVLTAGIFQDSVAKYVALLLVVVDVGSLTESTTNGKQWSSTHVLGMYTC